MEKIYLVIQTSSQEPFNPLIVKRKSLEEAIEYFNQCIQERNDDSWKKKIIDLDVNKEFDRYEAKLLVNHKGWGFDYVIGVKIDSINLSLI